AAGAGADALRVERVPEALRHAARERVQMRERDRRHVVVPEDDVPVPVAAERARRVLVPDEAREGARGGAIVGFLGRRLDVLPYRYRVRVAVDAGGRAEIERRGRVRDAEREEP